MSYYDKCFAHFPEYEINNAVGFVFTSVQDRINYDINYHYAPLGTTFWMNVGQNYIKYSNQWVASSNEVLKACGVYVDGAVTCDIDVIVNNQKISTQTNIPLNYAGFHTITLDNPAKITKGQNFRIEVSLRSNYNICIPIELSRPTAENTFVYSKASSNFGESEVFDNGKWVDINIWYPNANLCLNVYADYDAPIPTRIDASDLTMNEGENKYIIATLYDIKDNKLKNMGMTVCINGVIGMGTTDSNGQISLPCTMTVGTYELTVSFSGNEGYKNSSKSITLSVNPVIIQATTAPRPTNPIIIPPQDPQKIEVKGITNNKAYAYNAKIKLTLYPKVTLNSVKITGNNKKYTPNFPNGVRTMDLSKYNLKKNKSYQFTFYYENSNVGDLIKILIYEPCFFQFLII